VAVKLKALHPVVEMELHSVVKQKAGTCNAKHK
jgi:hypothetical protein